MSTLMPYPVVLVLFIFIFFFVLNHSSSRSFDNVHAEIVCSVPCDRVACRSSHQFWHLVSQSAFSVPQLVCPTCLS